MSQLVLSLFPGIGLLDRAFESEGFCIVRGPDVLWGGDVKKFHPPAGKFDGIIGGPPCQKFSEGAIAAGGSSQENLIPEFERCVSEAQPMWFVMENVRRAPMPSVEDYEVHARLLNNRWFGAIQNRVRRFSFGWRGALRKLFPQEYALLHPIKKRAVLASDGKRGGCGSTFPSRRGKMGCEKFTLKQARELQGLPEDFLAWAPFTKEGSYRVIGNGVPLPMGIAIAKAVKSAIEKL